MATVIDSLVVVLGLDPKNFTEGQKKAGESLLKMRQDAGANRKAFEESNRHIADAFRSTKNEVLAFGAAIIGAASVADFVKQTVALDANVGRLAHNLGTSTESLSMWQGAVQLVGGSADDATTSITSLVSAIEKTKFGIIGPQVLALQSLLGGISAEDEDPDVLLTKLHNRFSKMDPKLVSTVYAPALGLSPAMANLLMLPDKQFKDYLTQVRAAYLIHEEDAKAAQDAQEKVKLLSLAYQRLGNDVLNQVLPTLTDLATELTDMAEHDPEIRTLATDLGDLAKAMISVGTAADGSQNAIGKFFGWLGNALAKDFDSSIRTWTHVLNAISAIASGDWKRAGSELKAADAAAAEGTAAVFGGGGGAAAPGTPGGRGRGAIVPSGAGVAPGATGSEAAAVGGQSGDRAPLSVRNNNPGNLVDPATGKFRVFAGADEGLAAMKRQIVRDFQVHGLSTIAQLINDPHWGWSNQWAKGNSAASTMNYIRAVASALGVSPNARVNLADPRILTIVSRAMAGVEAGSSGGSRQHTTHIHLNGGLHVHTPATNAKGIAKDIHTALVTQAQRGLT